MLEVFRTLAATSSFTETAAAHGLSQPAVSNLVRKLESETGLVLFDRKLGGAGLTAAGRKFHEAADDTCAAFAEFTAAAVCAERRKNGTVLVGVDRSRFGRKILSALSDGCFTAAEAGPLWRAGLLRGEVDLVVAARFLHGEAEREIQSATLFSERGITIAWNPAFFPFDQAAFQFPDILASSLLIPSDHVVEGFAKLLVLWCRSAYGTSPSSLVEFDSEDDAREAAAAGIGIWIAPGNAMGGPSEADLCQVKTFEFLLPEAYRLEIHCRADEENPQVLGAAAALAKNCRSLFR